MKIFKRAGIVSGIVKALCGAGLGAVTYKTIQSKKMLVFLACLCLSLAAHATVVTYPQLTALQGKQFSYTLQARDHGTTTWNSVALYNAQVTNQSGSGVNTTVGNFSCSGSTDIQITFSATVTNAAVRPSSLGITPTISGTTITFTIAGPAKFYVDINGDHYNNCMHIIADSIEVTPPKQGDANVIFIPTGTFDNTVRTLTSGQTLYIQGGAAVAGVVVDNASNTKILGRGFIWRSSFDAISAQHASNVTIDGIIDFNHGWGGGGGCGIRCGQSSNVSISNTVSFSSKTWGDGYDIFSSTNITVNDVFIRTNDDAIAFYGGGKSGFTGDCKNITVTNSVLLPDLAQCFHVGVYGDQNINTEIRDVTVSNIDICDWNRVSGRPVIYFTVGDRVRAVNFHFNNVRATGYMGSSFSKGFIGMAIVYNSSYNYNPGRAIDSVYYTNCSYTQSGYSPGSDIHGYDATRKITNVFFQNLKINGTTITSAAAGNFSIGTYTSNITFTAANTIVTRQQSCTGSGSFLMVTGRNIHYAIPYDAFVRIRIFDMNGALVGNSIFTKQHAGSYACMVDHRLFRRGSYVVELTSGNLHIQQKTVIVN